jgi:predicted dehydrogenase
MVDVKSKELLEEERVAHTQHLNLSSSSKTTNNTNSILSTSGGGTSFIPAPHSIRLGILGVERTNKKTVSAIRNIISLCTVTAIASKDHSEVERFINDWTNHPSGGSRSDIAVFPGDSTFAIADLLESDLIDAIYIPYPDKFQKSIIIKALECNKHVIIDLPCGPCSLDDMTEIVDAAKKSGKLFMDGSKFAHHQRTTDFINRIACPDFGPVRQIDVEFSVMKDDAKSTDELLWLSEHSNVIASLGWYCARIAVSILEETKGDEEAGIGQLKKATIKSMGKDEAGNLNEVKAEVAFASDCILSFQCSLGTRPTKQSLKVFADEFSGEMFDTFHQHDIFTSFQIHKKEFNSDPMIQGPIEIVDSIECRAGPLQEAYIWRKFGALARGIDDACLAHKLPLHNKVEWPEGPAAREANLMLDSALETQIIIDALMRCVEERGDK